MAELSATRSRLGLVGDDPSLGAVEVWKAEKEGWKVPPAHQEQWGEQGEAPKTRPSGLGFRATHPPPRVPGDKSL